MNGKTYPAHSYVVKSAQAFRPHVLDMFEPQDHPNDFKVPGGPPSAPYDITGWTLAKQMGVEYDRILDGFDGPFVKVTALQEPPAQPFTSASAGYLISHRENDSFILINRLLKAKCEVSWFKKELTADGEDLGTGAIWVPATPAANAILQAGAKQPGIRMHAVSAKPQGDSLKLNPVRVGLYDAYGGIAPSGWTRWLLEQFEFPVEVVYPATLNAGDLRSRFDVLLLTDGAYPGSNASTPPRQEEIPAEYRDRIGRITPDRTIPELKKFVQTGGEIIAIGGSSRIGDLLGVPVQNAVAGLGPDKFYIPGSLLKLNVDNTNPLAFGMPKQTRRVLR